MSPSVPSSTSAVIPVPNKMPNSQPVFDQLRQTGPPSLDPPSSASSSPSTLLPPTIGDQVARAPNSPPLNVVITGGSNGIGAATVRAFATAGHRVLFTYLTGYPRARDLQTQFPSTTPVHLDQGDISSVARFALAVASWAAGRGVHVLVNNAALGSATVHGYIKRLNHQKQEPQPPQPQPPSKVLPPPPQHKQQQPHQEQQPQQQSQDVVYSPPIDVGNFATKQQSQQKQQKQHHQPNGNGVADSPTARSVEHLLQRAAADEALLKVNALGPLWVTDALIDLIRTAAEGSAQRRSSVIFIGSVGGGSSAVFPEYCPADLMSKAAMTYLSKHVAARYVQHPIDVMCVSPGATETEMFRKSTLSKVGDVHSFVNSMPKRRLIQPEDVAATICWLATQSPPGLFHGANLDASMGLAVRPGLQTETENAR